MIDLGLDEAPELCPGCDCKRQNIVWCYAWLCWLCSTCRVSRTDSELRVTLEMRKANPAPLREIVTVTGRPV